MFSRLRPLLALLLLTAAARANPVVAPNGKPGKPPAADPTRRPGERCWIYVSGGDGRGSVLTIPSGFLDGLVQTRERALPRLGASTAAAGLALAAAAGCLGVLLIRARVGRAAIGSAACVLAGVLLVGVSCSPVPRHDDTGPS